MNTKLSFLTLAIVVAASVAGFGQTTLQFSTNIYYVAENAGLAILNVRRTGDTNAVVSVDYATADGTATSGLKYTATNGTLTFAAGETNQAIVVPILNDALVEATKGFRVNLSNPTNALLGTRKTVSVYITDNDKGLAFEFSGYSVAEDAGWVLLGVVREDDGDFPVSVDYFTTDIRAINGVDYTGVTNTLFFVAGEKVQTFTVPILNDGLQENSKTFRVTLSNPTNQVLGAQKIVTVTILDNDPGVQFEFSQYWLQENEGAVTVRVLRGNDVNLPPFTVNFASSNLTALAGQDYTETNGTLTFTAGETVKTITVPVTYDEVEEADETCKLTLLTNGTEGVVLGSNKTATIRLLDTTGMAAHRFDRMAVLPNQNVQLTLAGGVHKRFKDYFDLYPIEVSTNLVDWAPLVTLVRTNASTNALTYVDTQTGSDTQRFYRTINDHFITSADAPTGPFAAGVISRLVTDPTRRNRYGVSANGSFMISIWYPAVARAGQVPGPFEDAILARDPIYEAKCLLRFPTMRAFRADAPYFRAHALPDAAWANTAIPCAVVINSPGAGAPRYDMSEKGPLLASHGYVVISVDHFDVITTVFPDGTVLQGTTFDANSTAQVQDRVQDLRFVLDQLESWNIEDPFFQGCLDVTKVATMGMSWGGGVACETARVDPRCRAVIVLEGYFQGADDVVRLGLQKPSLSLYADPIGAPGSELLLFNHPATRDAIWFQISSTIHQNFLDFYWMLLPQFVPGSHEVERVFSTYGLWFLNKHLKGIEAPMPALAAYPRVINFKQK